MRMRGVSMALGYTTARRSLGLEEREHRQGKKAGEKTSTHGRPSSLTPTITIPEPPVYT